MALNLLLVDDSPIVRAVIKKAVMAANLPLEAVHEAGNGRAALDLLQSQWVDLIFADIHMPVMGGEEMIDQMQHDPVLRLIPVIVVSTEGSKARMEHLISKGVKAYLRKPITPEQIRQVILDVVGFRLPHQEVGSTEQIVRDVLERMAFMFADPATTDELAQPPSDALQAEMTFKGAFTGSLSMTASPRLCNEMARNILGESLGAESEESGAAALQELLNVMCGRLLTSLAGDEPVFQLSIPQTRHIDAESWRRFSEPSATLRFLVEDEPMMLLFKVDQPVSRMEADH